MAKKVLLLSIKPQYAEKIFNGTKKVELRKVKPKLQQGDIVVIYVTAPVKAIVGTFEVNGLLLDSPKLLWHQVKHMAGVSKEEYTQYYNGSSLGVGIMCANVKELEKPLDLAFLRQNWQKFTPPQLYRYLSHDESNLLENSLSF